MRENTIIIVMTIVITAIQKIIPISEGKTIFAYVLPYFLFITRFVGLLTLFNIPISNKFIFGSEVGILAVSFVMFLMAALRHEYLIHWFSLLLIVLLSALYVGVIEYMNRKYFIYEEVTRITKNRRDYDELS